MPALADRAVVGVAPGFAARGSLCQLEADEPFLAFTAVAWVKVAA